MQKHVRLSKWDCSARSIKALITLSLLMVFSTSWAQKIVTGQVTDATDKLEVIGATVQVKGTSAAVMTDVDGKYSINVPSNTSVLVFSFVGKQTQEILVGTQSIVNVSLVNDAQSLEDIVVVAYGTRKKADLTGSVVAITAKDFQKGNIQSSDQLLQGKVAGLQVTSGGGAAGGGSTIRIRGAASLNASNDPLIVIDGIPVEGNGIAGSANLLNTINPNDIESMSVLKDASATALYGSRASNGVIIITTKKGSTGKPRFNFNTLFSTSVIPNTVDVLNGNQVREMINNHAATSGNTTYQEMLGNANTNWQDQIFRTAVGSDNNISAAGAYKNMPYRVSFGYSNQQGILKTNNFDRKSLAVNLNPKFLNDRLKFNINAKYTNTANRFADEGAIGAALRMDPTQDIYQEGNRFGGYWEWTGADGNHNNLAGQNPLALLELRDNTSKVNRFLGNIELDYAIPFVEGLTFKTNLGLDNTLGKGNDLWSPNSALHYLTNGRSTQYKEGKVNKLWDVSLFYEKELPGLKSKFDVLALHSYQDFLTKNYNFASYSYDGSAAIPGTEPVFATDRPQYRLDSYLGRINYTFMDKYLFTGSLRRDASSKFSPNTRVGYFPAAAFAWKMKDEFFAGNKNVSELKFRAGWGVTGQQDFSQYYPYLARYTQSNATANYQFGNTFYPFYRPIAYDANIKWETTTTTNLGIDFGFYNNRISGSVEVYNKDTKDLLSTVPVAYGSTFDIALFTNVGNLNNKGFEVVLNTTPIMKGDFKWDLGFNFSRNRTNIESLINHEDPNFTGIPVSGISGGTGNNIGIHAVGQWPFSYNVYQQVYGANGQPLEGVYVDRNQDGAITDADRYLFKKPAPNTLFGVNTSMNYKKFTLSASGHAMFGNYLYNNLQSERSTMRNLLNPVGAINNATTLLPQIGFFNNHYLSNYYVENASFFRMDNINIGYYVGKVFGNTTLSLNAGVNNVFVITKYSGLDPENSNPSGVDNTVYPRPRVFSFGLNFDF